MDNEPTIEPTRVESKITEAAATKQLTALLSRSQQCRRRARSRSRSSR
jgi:hypothetical protein